MIVERSWVAPVLVIMQMGCKYEAQFSWISAWLITESNSFAVYWVLKEIFDIVQLSSIWMER